MRPGLVAPVLAALGRRQESTISPQSPLEVVGLAGALSDVLTDISDRLPPCYRRSAPSIDPELMPNTPECKPYIDYVGSWAESCDGSFIPGGDSVENQGLLNVICFCRYGVDKNYYNVFEPCGAALCPKESTEWPGQYETLINSFNNVTDTTFEQCPVFIPRLAELVKTGFEIDAGGNQTLTFQPMTFTEGYFDFTTHYPTPTPTHTEKPKPTVVPTTKKGHVKPTKKPHPKPTKKTCKITSTKKPVPTKKPGHPHGPGPKGHGGHW